MYSKSVLIRLYAKINQQKEDTCWLWTGSINKDGYGSFNLAGKIISPHILILSIKLNKILIEDALHTCDNRSCCNPKHLYEGSKQQNTWDREYRNRHKQIQQKSYLSQNSKLTSDEILEIKRRLLLGESMKKLANEFWVCKGLISLIKNKDIHNGT